jgi:hypothetical protein
MKPKSIYKDVWNNTYGTLNDSIFGLKPKFKQISEKQMQLLNDTSVPFLAHFVVQSTEHFVTRRFFNYKFRSIVFNKSLKLFNEFHTYATANYNEFLDIIHNNERDKLSKLNVSNDVKKIINQIMDMHMSHNKNTMNNKYAFSDFVVKNKNIIY